MSIFHEIQMAIFQYCVMLQSLNHPHLVSQCTGY